MIHIYLDMDGVVCNFLKAAGDLIGKDLHNHDEWAKVRDTAWKKINEEGEFFWANLEWNMGGKALWEYINYLPVTILTAYPASTGNRAYAKIGKLQWILANFGDEMAIRAIVCHVKEKQLLSGDQKVLIDDNKMTIEQWRDKGGIGIHHVNALSTIKELKDMGL